MKIFAIIFMVLGVLGLLYNIPNALLVMNVPGGGSIAIIQFTIAFFSFFAAFSGFQFYNRAKYKEQIISIIQNLKARDKITGENFSLKIINEKAFSGIQKCDVGVKINDEDKGRISIGEENTYDLPEGSHKLQFYTTTFKNSVTNYPPAVINFTKNSTLIVSLKYSNFFGAWMITN